MSDNQLKINVTKTKTVVFPKEKEKSINFLKHAVLADETKYLGILVDECLNLKSHIKTIKQKCARNVSMFYQLPKFMTRPFLLLAYFTYVQPIYQYGVLIYGPANKTSLAELEKQQKMLIRIIFGLRKHQSTAELRYKFKIPLVRELHLYELLKLFAKILMNKHSSKSVND